MDIVVRNGKVLRAGSDVDKVAAPHAAGNGAIVLVKTAATTGIKIAVVWPPPIPL